MNEQHNQPMQERGGLSPAPSTLGAPDQNQAEQAQETGGNASADTTVDTTPKRPWTPGPWGLWRGPQYVGGGEDICIGAGKEWLANMDHRRPSCQNVLSPGHMDDECDICSIDSGEISREQLANAHLIVAAPELFEALQGFVEEMPICCCHESWTKRGRVDPQCVRCNFKECIEDAEAALAKAMGVNGG